MNIRANLGLILQPDMGESERSTVIYTNNPVDLTIKLLDGIADYPRTRNHEFDHTAYLFYSDLFADGGTLKEIESRFTDKLGFSRLRKYENVYRYTNEYYVLDMIAALKLATCCGFDSEKPKLIFIVGYPATTEIINAICDCTNERNHIIMITCNNWNDDYREYIAKNIRNITFAEARNNGEDIVEVLDNQNSTEIGIDVTADGSVSMKVSYNIRPRFPDDATRVVDITLLSQDDDMLDAMRPVIPTLKRISQVHNNDDIRLNVFAFDLSDLDESQHMNTKITSFSPDELDLWGIPYTNEWLVDLVDDNGRLYIMCEISAMKRLAQYALCTIMDEVRRLLVNDLKIHPEKYKG